MPLWRGPAEGRVRIASPYRLRAGRFGHLFVASLQDGEFPRRDGGSPFLSDEQRAQLGLPERAETEAEERYLFYVCLPCRPSGLWLSCRDSDESGGAEQPSPLLAEVRRLLDPPPPEDPEEGDPLEPTWSAAAASAQVVFAPCRGAERGRAGPLARRPRRGGARASSPALGVDPRPWAAAGSAAAGGGRGPARARTRRRGRSWCRR